eukprot:m.275416 g.275416  ORF g.275416 m.275416 type:complete len:77 (-) comp118525_c0_seq1:163-393(-)
MLPLMLMSVVFVLVVSVLFVRRDKVVSGVCYSCCLRLLVVAKGAGLLLQRGATFENAIQLQQVSHRETPTDIAVLL